MKVVAVDPKRLPALRQALERQGFAMEERPSQAFLARLGKATVSAYLSGKVVVTNEDAALLWVLEQHAAPEEARPASALDGVTGARIGVDEAGKGDYFGPLVTAAVHVADDRMAQRLRDLGVKDSKKLGNVTVSNLAVEIRRILPGASWKTVPLTPAKYNVLHFEMRNVNKVLGWSHARAIEDVLRGNRDCPLAISDQFGDRRFIEDKLRDLGREVRLVQEPRAEREVAVAAASILARDAFLRHMDEMTRDYGIQFPRGANNVLAAAREVHERLGAGGLLATAKVHFRTTAAVVGDDREVLAELAAMQRQNTPRPDGSRAPGIHLEVYSILHSFEREVRGVVEDGLRRLHGDGWWTAGVKPGLRKAAENLQKTETARGRSARAIDCLYLSDLGLIIREVPNWRGVFQEAFGEQNSFNSRYEVLAEIRNPAMHARDLRTEDKLAVIAHVGDLRRRIASWRAKAPPEGAGSQRNG